MRAVALLLAGALIAGSCSSALSLSAYGDAVQDLGRSYEESTTTLQRDLETNLQREIDLLRRRVDQSDPAAVAAFADEAVSITRTRTKEFFASVGDALHVYRSALAELHPPGEVADQHAEMLAAMDGMLSGLTSLLDELPGADSFDGIDTVVHASAFTDAQPRFTTACRALEAAIQDRGVTANLRCPA